MRKLNSALYHLRSRLKGKRGFTLVELVIVVAVIGILTAIAIPAYGTIQENARQSASKDGLNDLRQAIELARQNQNASLVAITGSGCTRCLFTTDPLTVPKGTGGWLGYNSALKKISDASGMNVTGLLDGYGRPYVMDENEGEGGTKCSEDLVSASKDPYGSGNLVTYSIPMYTAKCVGAAS
jgi:prepilin-type N-terminal cleavage/methylation domain-containing protein